ncbi:hypothetical protein TCAL_10082 [Tigriopus californicus]|uniref:General transcription factor IIH subunit 4 n=1 Tax=Tigriopus californicus TaxID=6832 RepID=A0A553PC48_TIGCA|nr:general transcription factor IIH subunit 4-like [Tigriopus californicus]TRY75255.1 hypothetical protein TCAL_10082 [Tigriopus californicus]|eukprot:TCALIF_10082-PA protein Name:"Similar to GTF2H4 General transcription factor IIH subunit 4 (Pan troglodytes)" AED:0.10 eAED:0.10 QI:40/1/1/1/1/1/8/96/470
MSLLQCANLTDYLKTLGPSQLENLYVHPATALAVFRELPLLGQHYVLRLLHVEQSVPKAVVSSWVSRVDQYRKIEVQAMEALTNLRVWTSATNQAGMESLTLDDTFKQNLKTALMGGGSPWTTSRYLDLDPNRRDAAYLDQYSQERWDTVLHYMVGSSQQEGISADAVRILLSSGLMVVTPGTTEPTITRSGFQFLLMDTPSQVWFFILQYLDSVKSRNLNLTECLNFLFQLSFSELGKDYSTSGLSHGLLVFLQHLREFGLVYQRKRSAGRFYPTRLALNIASGENKSLLERHREGYIVVETNYRIYAYSNSNLQVALIGLFAEVLYRFPNLAVAVVTRDSIRQALRGGIKASQIVRFLQMHAHPRQQEQSQKKKRDEKLSNERAKDVIPGTVVDQIYLWEKERDRFTFEEGVLYNQFLSQGDYETVKNYADSQGVLNWSNDQNRTIIVSRAGHDDVRKFWRRHSRGGN